MSRSTILSPADTSTAVELGRTMFKKKILPIGTLEYKGRTLKFDRDYLSNVVTAFKQKAFDAVPFQLAGDDNAHTNAVDRTEGKFVDLEVGDDGLYGYLSATEKGSQIIRDNPDLPVSVKIVEDYERNDGQTTRHYPAALAHVLGTWGPRISGLGVWSEVAFSDEDGPVTDLSSVAFSEIPPVQENPKKEEGTPVPEITDEQAAAILAKLTPSKLLELLKDEALEGAPEPPVAKNINIDDKSDASGALAALKKTQDAIDGLDGKQVVVALKPKPDVAPKAPAIAASQDEDDTKHVDLAQVELATKVDRQAIELAELRAERDAEKWRYERESLVRDYGIPPAVVALAEPLLKGGKRSIELADGTSVDAGEVVRNLLKSVAKTYGKAVDLSGPKGTEHDFSEGADDAAKADQERLFALARKHKFGM